MNESDNDLFERRNTEPESPICLFYFSHPFSIGSHIPSESRLRKQSENKVPMKDYISTYIHQKTTLKGHRRYSSSSKTITGNTSNTRSRGRLSKKHSAWILIKYLTESIRLHSCKNKLPDFEEVVDTLQTAWPMNNKFSKYYSDNEDTSMAQNSQDQVSSELPSPVLLRRRLSAPETIMRKHVLSQQRSNSIESDITQLSSYSPFCRKISNYLRSSRTGSESNLSTRKTRHIRDSDSIRKSTLLRRFWSREFTGSLKRLYNEETFPKRENISVAPSIKAQQPQPNSLSQSIPLSPEQINMGKTNNNKWDSYSSYSSETMSRISSTSNSIKSIMESSSTDIKVPSSTTCTTSTETDVYTTTRCTTSTTTTDTNIDDNSDSAFTNNTHTYTTFSSSKSVSENNNNLEYNENIEKQPNFQSLTLSSKTDQQNSELKLLNLSATTLNIIINNSSDLNLDPKEQSIQPEKVESFYLKQENEPISENHSRLIKYMISNVGTGTAYTKIVDTSQLVIPRYSALPRSISMEVNQSAESTDKESDTGSLIDSLDDPNSPRQSATTPRIKHDDKPVRGDLSALLPDNSSSCRETPMKKIQKSSVFFVPIEDTPADIKAVAEHLPERVRNRLSKRQQKLDQKKLNNQNVDINGNPPTPRSLYFSSSTNSGIMRKVKKEKKTKGTPLPSYKINEIATTKVKHTKHSKLKYSESSESSSSLRQWKSPLNDQVNKSHEKVNTSNRIEILEIVEYVDHVPEKNIKNPVKSKIPVLVQQNKVPELQHRQMQNVFHAYNLYQVPEYSPKTDQLIANILIDALNRADMIDSKPQETSKILLSQSTNEKHPPSLSTMKQFSNKYEHKFEVIPEEKLSSLGSTEDSNSNIKTETELSILVQTDNDKKSSTDASSQTDIIAAPNAYKGKAALAIIKDEDLSTISKGWFTFYMLRQNPGSPDSSAGEGDNSEKRPDDKSDSLELQLKPVILKRRLGSSVNVGEDNNENDSLLLREESLKKLSLLSSDDSKNHTPTSSNPDCQSLPIALPSRQGRRQSHRRGRFKTSQNQGTNSSQIPGGWSVTVSGTNTCGQPAPDLEMRLKFPCPQPTSQSDSGLGDEHPRQPNRNFQQHPSNLNTTLNNNNQNYDFHLPPAKPVLPKKYTVITRKNNDDVVDVSSSRSFNYLPDLVKRKSQKTTMRRDSNNIPATRFHPSHHGALTRNLSSLTMPLVKPEQPQNVFGGLRPRQTLTSYRRFSLHHSKHLVPNFKTLLSSTGTSRKLLKLPECFPAKLAVTGSAISPENKPRVPTMSEKDLTRNHFNFGQHHP